MLRSGVVAKHISKPMPLGILEGLRAVIQRVVQHQLTTPLSGHQVENSPRRRSCGNRDDELAIQPITTITVHFGGFPSQVVTHFHLRSL